MRLYASSAIRLHLGTFAAWCAIAVCIAGDALGQSNARPLTYCNPIDLPYRFALKDNKYTKGKSLREAADPSVILHNGTYWLFASKCGGYWHSLDLVHWDFIDPTGYPTEEYAPTVCVLGDKWLMTASICRALYTTADPAIGTWTKLRDFPNCADPKLFVDDDGRLYFYWGSSADKPIYGVELDPKSNFDFIGRPTPLIPALDPIHHGWEARNQRGTDHQIASANYKPWLEGAAMFKHNGVYYLQYSAPGTEMREYADGAYTATRPLGPYTYAENSPASYKPTGFVGSAGHGCTFNTANGQVWRMVTQAIGVQHMFERRIGLYPVGFLPTGRGPDDLFTNTYLGDYPQLAPGQAKHPQDDNLVGWMLLSLKKPVIASSTLDRKHDPQLAVDEDIRASWAAATANPGEFLTVDLGKRCRVNAIQINFADVNSTFNGRLTADAYRYKIDISDDAQSWRPCLDRSNNQRDAPHDYEQLAEPVIARYVRITNVHTPAGAVFSRSGFRLFGSGLGQPPQAPAGVTVRREANRRLMDVAWSESSRADFYIVRYGIAPDRLTHNYQVYDGDRVTIPGLNTDAEYFAAVDAVNDTGIAKATGALEAQPQ